MNSAYIFGLVITVVVVKQLLIFISLPGQAQNKQQSTQIAVKELTNCQDNFNPPGTSKPKGSSGAGSRRMSSSGSDINSQHLSS